MSTWQEDSLPEWAKRQIGQLRAALMKAEEADQFHINCTECDGEGEAEACAACFPLADDARTMRWQALGLHEHADRKKANRKIQFINVIDGTRHPT